MKQTIRISAAILLLAGNTACQQNGKGGSDEINDTVEAARIKPAREAINIIPIVGSPEFGNAQIGMGIVNAENTGADSVKVTFNFSVKNYELKQQTADASTKKCNNSDKGQHIHFIMDNEPYAALYEPKHTITLAKNSEHYLFCFLSRSYHESLKNPGAALLYHFKVDANGKVSKLDDPKTPMLFYSRPKGNYLGNDTTNLLFDYYVWNAQLGSDYKVNAIIKNQNTGQEKTFTTDQWHASFIEHLGTGKSSVSIQLLDKENKPVAGPMTGATREFQMAAQEPLQ